MHHLIIIYAGVEQGVDDGHDDEEDEYTLVPEHLLHLLSPDVSGIFNDLFYIIMVCRHR
jgi:hypothetical protein